MDLQIFDINLAQAASHLLQLGLAFGLALPIAWDREREERSLGLRTFPLVAMASAGYILVAKTVLGGEASELARVIQGLMTGVGFLGGGAIIKQGLSVHGTATAASIWSTAAVGAAVAFGRLEIALALTAANFLTLRWLGSLKDVVQSEEESPSDS